MWKTSEGSVLQMFIVYKHPLDCPSGYVVRRWEILRGFTEPQSREGFAFPTLAQARAAVPKYLARIARDVNDDPSIFEVWL